MRIERLSAEALAASKVEGMGAMGNTITSLFKALVMDAKDEEEYLRSCLSMAIKLRTLPTAEKLRTPKVQENFIQMNTAMALMEERINKLLSRPQVERTRVSRSVGMSIDDHPLKVTRS
jgi:hypothetical protein